MAHGEWGYVATLLLFEMTNMFLDLVHQYGWRSMANFCKKKT